MNRFYESSQIVSKYLQYRPKLVQEIATYIISNMRKNGKTKNLNKWGTLLDVACGSGQATALLGPYFDKVYGIDISEQQILMARKIHKNKGYQFQVAAAENLPIESPSIDLVLCSVAAHWFDYNKFVSEAWRVLKPGGHIAIFCYFFPEIAYPTVEAKNSPKLAKRKTYAAQQLLKTFVEQCNNHPNIVHHLFDQKYDDIFKNLPGENKVIDRSLVLKIKGTLSDLRGHFESNENYVEHITSVRNSLAKKEEIFDKNKHDILEKFIQEIKLAWNVKEMKNEDVRVDQIYKTCTIVSQKPFC